jgi:serine/threonine protein kinase/Tfp pilus assembly protein PilF
MLGSRIGNYQVVEFLGRGGMGEIWAARDEKLNRLVALKALSPTIVDDPRSRSRILAEARAAAALDHPFICTVHEVVEYEQRALIVMEYVRGETLDQRIARGPLSIGEICRIAVETAEALAAAHRGGVVHRDLKPANIMLTSSGHVKVMDFGLALTATAADEDPTARYSEPSLRRVAGTLPYIAPEVLSGSAAGVQADLYSLGVVLYEIGTGQRPFRNPSLSALVGEILTVTPRNPAEVNPALPAGFADLVVRLLSKEPSHRSANAEQLLEELRTIAAERSRDPAASRPARSLAVLPFKQLRPDPESAHLGIGLADATITELAMVRSLLVRPTASILRFAEAGVDPVEAGRQLGVDAVVDASFQRAGTRLRITVQLISTAERRSLWSTKIDTRLEDFFAVQDEVSRKIVEALQIELTPGDERRIARVAQPAGEAYDLYLRGRSYLLRQTLDDVHAAVAYFERARQADPTNPLPWTGLADSYARLAFTFEPEAGWNEKAREICDRLLELDPGSPDGHYIRGLLLWSPGAGFNHGAAIREFATALAAKPSLSEALDWLATVLFHVGMVEEAQQELGRAQAINPDSFTTMADQAFCHLLERRYDDALETARGVQSRVAHGLAHYVEAMVHVHRGDLDDAVRGAEYALRHQITPVRFYGVLGLVAALRGDAAGADQQVEQTLRHRKEYGHFHHAQYDIGCIYAILGQNEQAVEWLTASARNGFPCASGFRSDPLLASLRGHPPFEKLIAELEVECATYGRVYRGSL